MRVWIFFDGGLVGGSAPMSAAYEEIERAARTWNSVLLLGEPGSGKGAVAREIHARGELPGQPFITQVCAASSEAQLEVELFGQAGSRGRGALEREIEAMESDGRRFPWRDGLPDRIIACLRPFRERLEATYSPVTNPFELSRNRKQGSWSIQAD